MSTALDYKHQVYSNKPKRAFLKAQKVYGKRMQNAPRNSINKQEITTDFKELLRLRKANARRKDRSSARFQLFIGLSLSIFLVVFLVMTVGRLA